MDSADQIQSLQSDVAEAQDTAQQVQQEVSNVSGVRSGTQAVRNIQQEVKEAKIRAGLGSRSPTSTQSSETSPLNPTMSITDRTDSRVVNDGATQGLMSDEEEDNEDQVPLGEM